MYLGLDIGTSAVKAVVMDQTGEIVAQAVSPLSIQSPHASWNEQNPDDWWDAVCACSAQLSETPSYSEIQAIGLSGQMHGAVCLDEAHRPVRPAILWNDGRSHAECAEMKSRCPEIGAVTGAPPMPGFTAPKVLWLSKMEKDVYARIRHILLPKDYVRLKLSGELATDMSDAAGTMWLDQRTRRWSAEMCDVSATQDSWLPRLFEGTETTGTLTATAAQTLGLSKGLPIAGGGGDAATGAMGIGATNEDDAFISLGTSGQLFVTTGSYRPAPESAIHAYAHCIPERWFQMGAMLNGASALGWWASATKTPIPELLTELAEEEPQDAPFFLPYLTGERTPHNDPHIRGAFYGLNGETSRAAMTQAVLDAIAYSLCDARDALAAAGTAIPRAAVIGGGARSEQLLQTISDAMGTNLDRFKGAENGPALGAARLARIAAEGVSVEVVSSSPKIDRRFAPDANAHQRHALRHKTFRALYQALKPFAADESIKT